MSEPQWFETRSRQDTHPYGTPYGATVAPPQPAPAAPSGPQAAPPPRRSTGRRVGELLTVATLAALLGSGGTLALSQAVDGQGPSAAASTQGTTTAVQAAAPAIGTTDWQTTAAKVTPSVASIGARSATGAGEGSGVIIDTSGHVLTNNHVVAGATQLTVTLSDGRSYRATVQGTDPSTDLAVLTLQSPPDDLTPIELGDSDALRVGDAVMAVGNPLGLSGTVTTGIVSALDRPVTTSGEGRQGESEPVVTNAIQTSAAINPGNSGGALVDTAGRLVGINSSIASLGSTGGQSGNIGIGFAIPVKQAKLIADQLIRSGSAQHAYLGITPGDGRATVGSATRAGAEVRAVEGGTPAAEAGLRAGDVIVAVGQDRVESAESLVATIREQAVGTRVELTVFRDGREEKVTAALAARPQG